MQDRRSWRLAAKSSSAAAAMAACRQAAWRHSWSGRHAAIAAQRQGGLPPEAMAASSFYPHGGSPLARRLAARGQTIFRQVYISACTAASLCIAACRYDCMHLNGGSPPHSHAWRLAAKFLVTAACRQTNYGLLADMSGRTECDSAAPACHHA